MTSNSPYITPTPQCDGGEPIHVRLKGLARDDWETYRDTTARYEAAWSAAVDPPVIDDFLPPPGHQPLRSLLLTHLIQEEYERTQRPRRTRRDDRVLRPLPRTAGRSLGDPRAHVVGGSDCILGSETDERPSTRNRPFRRATDSCASWPAEE